jgi:uncharacterized repeat protein (TIGR03806 family)
VLARARLSRRAAPAAALIALAAIGCGGGSPAGPDFEFASLAEAPQNLSVYALFEGEPREQRPAPGVVPYDLRTALFSDYASKFRFIKLPAGQKAIYSPDDTIDFPVGTIIAKTFAYPVDLRQPDGPVDLLETRILLHQKAGWIGLPYVWNEDESEATLRLAGTMLAASWTDAAGARVDHQYLVPNANQCKGCHRVTGDTFEPIGPKARYLNRDFAYAGGTENQLAHWSRVGVLEGAPPPEDAPRVPVWDDPASGSLEDRARTYLEINCAHCHSTGGPARTTGLDLTWGAHEPVKLGVYKFPVAAGRGSGDRLYGIVPGKPDESILMYRMLSLDPGVMMPELGRRMVHTEGVELLREWIAAMPDVARGGRGPRADAAAPAAGG